MVEPRHYPACWYEPDAIGWRCVAACPHWRQPAIKGFLGFLLDRRARQRREEAAP